VRPLRDIENIKKLAALEYPEVVSFRCVEVVIPDDNKYLHALAGFISLLADSWSYSGARNDRIYRAALWKMALSLTTWAECMNCEELTECLQPLFDELRVQINQDAVFRQYGTEYPVGVPLPPEAYNAPLAPGSNPTCNLDILWSQSEQTIDFGNGMIEQALDLLETATNNAEAIAALTQLPIIDEFGFDALAQYAELLLDGIAENYAAAFSPEYRTEVACGIFCLASQDCEITLELLYEFFLSRVEAYWGTPIGAVTTIANVLSYMLDQDVDGTIVADAMMLIIFASAKYGNTFLGTVGTVQLEAVMELAVNDANDDWSILCDCGWYSEMDVTADMFTWEVNPTGFNWGTWTDTVGIVSGFDTSDGNAYQMVQIKLTFAAPASIRRMAFDYDLTSGTQSTGVPLAVGTDNVSVDTSVVPADGTDLTFDRELVDPAANQIALRCQAGFVPASVVDPGGSSIVKRIRVWGLGTKPAELP